MRNSECGHLSQILSTMEYDVISLMAVDVHTLRWLTGLKPK